MNSLNLLSSRVIGQTPVRSRPRSRSQGEVLRSKLNEELLRGRSFSEDRLKQLADEADSAVADTNLDEAQDGTITPVSEIDDEKQPLLHEPTGHQTTTYTGLRYLIKRITDALTALLSTVGMPVVYVVQCFQDEDGHYSALVPFRRRKRRKAAKASLSAAAGQDQWSEKSSNSNSQPSKLRHRYSNESLNSLTSESENDMKQSRRGARNENVDGGQAKPRRQSTRIKLLHNNEAVDKRKRKGGIPDQSMSADNGTLTVDSLKSPTSTALRVTRYPHTPQPPRPLVPRRQPSYTNLIPRSPARFTFQPQQKTLVLDLDETLIHSMAKGGRMSTGHMVEVKLNVPVALSPSQTGQQPPALIGPQHPILYYVHKRPYCDEFLRKIAKWFKLVIFTASVQEYADPVIDWLEQERKFFQGRYYRQHCTFRNGSYIKDLSSIEPDLSKVMILDNSPISYIFHEDNAIPIEGWINDPTDNDLLHLVPMLEALQYVSDVRALLALRRGESDTT